jgi:ferritin
MISKNAVKALNEQITKEMYSAYLYQSMAAFSAGISLKGFAHWFEVQALEELFHAEKMYNYILDQNERVILDSIQKPPSDFSSPADMFEKTLEHERTVTASINAIAELAKKEGDNATYNFMLWFVNEQIEEEATPAEILGRLKLAGEGSGLFMMDAELGARVYTPPAVPRKFKLFLS